MKYRKPLLVMAGIVGGLFLLTWPIAGMDGLIAMTFGLAAGVPSLLLVLLSSRRPPADDDDGDQPAAVPSSPAEQTAPVYPAEFVPKAYTTPAWMEDRVTGRFAWIAPRKDGE